MILEHNGVLRLQPASYYEGLDRKELRLWCRDHARYGLPTQELVQWLRDYIGSRTAIEVGAGSGDLCYYLGIQGTDNHMQEWPEVRDYYRLLHQPTIRYGGWVEEIAALDAVAKYRPQVVVASWVTHWIDPELPPPPGGGNMYGIKEHEVLAQVEEYILIGNLHTHRYKPLLQRPHTCHKLPFVHSRAEFPDKDRVFSWVRPKAL